MEIVKESKENTEKELNPFTCHNAYKEPTKEEIKIDMWVDALKRDFPNVDEYFIRTLAKSYSSDPSKIDAIIESGEKVPTKERMNGGNYQSITVFQSPDDVPKDDYGSFPEKETK